MTSLAFQGTQLLIPESPATMFTPYEKYTRVEKEIYHRVIPRLDTVYYLTYYYASQVIRIIFLKERKNKYMS